MVSLGVGRGGSVAQAFQEGEQQALSGRMSRQQMQLAAAEEARRAQEFDWSGQDRARAASTAGIGLPESIGGGFGGFGGAAPASPPTSGAPAPGASLSRPGLSFGAPPATGSTRPPGAPNLRFALLRHFEGFSSKPYWDVNAYRGGFGSDTVTLADGRVIPVRPGMNITREDAERDLERRGNQEFAPRAAQQVGQEIWASLPEHVTEPLVSVAYNYGSLPRSVVAAVKTGDPEKIAQAVEGLAGHNGGVNRRRRMQEAAIIRSGGQIDPGLMRAAAAPTGQPGASRLQQAPDRMFMQSDSMQTRAGLAEPYMLGRTATDAYQSPPEEESARRGPFEYLFGATAQARREARAAQIDAERQAAGLPPLPTAEALAGQLGAQMPAERQAVAPPPVPTIESLADQFDIRVPAGLQVPAELQVDESAVRPQARPREDMRPTLEELETQGGVTEDRVAPPPSVAQRPAGTYSMGDGTEFTIPSAGLRSDDPATSDIRRGGTASTVSPDLGAMRALFTDAPALALSRQQLALEEESLRQQYRIAQGSQNFAAMAQITGAFAVVQARQRAANYMEAGILAQQGNFDPLSQALSEMNGSSVRVTPIDGNTVRVESAAGVKQVPVSEMLSLYRQAVDEGYQQQLAAQAAEEASRRQEYYKTQLKILEATSLQQATMNREQANAFFAEELKRAFPQSEFFTEKQTVANDVETIIVYDRKGNAPPFAFERRENPKKPGQFNLVEVDITSLR